MLLKKVFVLAPLFAGLLLLSCGHVPAKLDNSPIDTADKKI
jgi:hypothetical protein